MKVAFYTLGCKVNQYETQAMRALFEAAGHTTVPFDARADAYVVNTCTVTQTSDHKSRAMLARAHRLNPDAAVTSSWNTSMRSLRRKRWRRLRACRS